MGGLYDSRDKLQLPEQSAERGEAEVELGTMRLIVSAASASPTVNTAFGHDHGPTPTLIPTR
jgi:hypothetical protein